MHATIELKYTVTS